MFLPPYGRLNLKFQCPMDGTESNKFLPFLHCPQRVGPTDRPSTRATLIQLPSETIFVPLLAKYEAHHTPYHLQILRY